MVIFSYILILLLGISQRVNSVFRFCHQGTWHELKEEDCPFGLLFNEKITPPCFYTQGKDNTTARVWPSVCDDVPFVNDKEDGLALVGDDFLLAQKNAEMQIIQYGITEPSNQLPIWDDVVDMSTCEELCSLSLEKDNMPQIKTSHEEGDSMEKVRIPRGEINDTQVMALTDQTLRLGDYLFDELNPEELNRRAEENGPDLRIVQLYKKTIKILAKTCPDPFIPEDFRNRILSGFLFLVQDTGIGEVDDISAEEFEEIMSALRSCENMNPTFRLEGTVCSMKTVASQIIKILPDGEELEAEYKPASWEKDKIVFPFKTYDPFTEFAWQAVTAIHGTCFASFKPDANMHHKYTSAMEHLFGDKIRFRWKNPTQLEDARMWGTWFLADLNTTHLNFGACISGAYEGAPFAMKLDRPIEKLEKMVQSKKRKRKKRDAEDISSTTEQSVPEESTTKTIVEVGTTESARVQDESTNQVVEDETTTEEVGKETEALVTSTTTLRPEETATEGIEGYWKYYRSTGGITSKLMGDIECFKTQDKRDLVVKELKEAICINPKATTTDSNNITL